MDYLGWELERQRSALAVLLGVRTARDRESVRDEARRSGTGMPEPDDGGSQQAPGAWEAVQAGRRDRENGGARAVETPVSAWEAVRSGEAVWAVRQDREDPGAGIAEPPVSAWETILGEEAGIPVNSEEGARLRLIGGTGAQPEFLRPSGGYVPQGGTRQIKSNQVTNTQGLPAGIGEGGARDSAASSEAGANQNKIAGGNAADGRSGQFFRIRRGGGRASDTLDRGEPVVSTSPRGGGFGAAALRAEDSARLISRAVQRDARRYDGGFNIY